MAQTVLHIDRPFDEDVVRSVVGSDVILLGPEDPLEWALGAIVGAATWNSTRFDAAPSLQVLARTGIGVDAVDLAEATRRRVMVTNTPDGPTVSTAEHTMALLFAVAKTLPHHQQMLRDAAGSYTANSRAVELDGLTLGLVAYGRIARRVAAMAAAVGMKVVAHDPFLTADATAGDPAEVELVAFDRLLDSADVISLHCPLTDESRRLFRAEIFARCKPGLIFVNAARGGLVDHDDLLAALDSGQVIAAGLDVTDPEPLPPDHPLLHRLDVIVTPHVASSTVVGRRRMLVMALEQAMAALDGSTPTHLVNRDVLG
ncbi:MAG: hypothetical protein OES24_12835 [Acidimicrobiia bacterium]|nr:hypothetical protein [Acidimicrobiia bacterium]